MLLAVKQTVFAEEVTIKQNNNGMFHQISDEAFFMLVRPYLTQVTPQCAQPVVILYSMALSQ